MGRSIKWKYKKNIHQKEFHEDVSSKFLHMSSGFGGGKTYALCYKVLQLSYLNKDIPGGLIAPDFSDLEKDVLPTMEEILQRHRVNYVYRSGKYFKFPWSKAKCYLASAKKRIRGPNWGWACINEVTLIPYVRYKEIIGRVRIKKSKHPQIASSGTPEGFGSDYHEHMIEKPFSKNLRVIYGNTMDNLENLSEDYVKSLEDSYDSVMLDAYLKGLFVNMVGNRFYYAYDQANEDPTIEEFNGYETVHVHIDFNVEHMSAGVWRSNGHRIEGIDEIVIPNNASTDKMCEALKERGYLPDNTVIYPDPSGNSRSTKGTTDVDIIKSHGYYNIQVRKKAPGMRERQNSANNLLSKKRAKIHPGRMPTMKKDFMAVTQDPGTLQKSKENPKLTHMSDGFDYMLDHMFPSSGRRAGVAIQKYR